MNHTPEPQIEEEKDEFASIGTLVSMSWDNIYLKMEIECGENDVDFELYCKKKELCVPVPYEEYRGGKYIFKLNICTMNGRAFLENGRYNLLGNGKRIKVAHKVAYNYDNLSRVFKYSGRRMYTVMFMLDRLCSDEENIYLDMLSKFVIEDPDWKVRTRGPKGALLHTMTRIYSAFSHAPKKGRILLFNQTSDTITPNLKAIDDKLHEMGLDKTHKISYYFHADANRGKSYSRLIAAALAIRGNDIIFTDNYCPLFSVIDVPKGAKLIQLWHAGIGFKAVGFCRFGKDGSPQPQESCHRKYTMALSPSQSAIDIFNEVFAIGRDSFFVSPMPRMEGFTLKENIEKRRAEFFAEYPRLKGKKIILFAPTYRGRGQTTAYYDYDRLDFKRIGELCGDSAVFVMKMHPFIDEAPPIPENLKEKIIDLSSYPDINTMYCAADVMITDYSSSYFEYSSLGKPLLFYTYDREIYELTRGVHQSILENAPGKVCDTFDELYNALKDGDFELKKTLAFKKKHFPSDIPGCDELIKNALEM